MPSSDITRNRQSRALVLSTLAFTVCFAVWTIFSIIGVRIQEELGLNETQFGILVATPVLTGSVSRIFLGIWTDRIGGRRIYSVLMAATAVPVWLLSTVESYWAFLIAALGVGFAGGSFIVGIAYTAAWFEPRRQGTALGIYGAGNVGAAITNFGAPFLMVALGWEQTARIYALGLIATAILFWFLTEEDPASAQREAGTRKISTLRQQLEPLKYLQVWRFGLYYFFVFGGFVALASWLPRYYVGAYGADITAAGMLATAYSLPASVFRALGGWLSDRWGARSVMYIVFIGTLAICFVLSYPPTSYRVDGIRGPIEFTLALGVAPFALLTLLLGFLMSLGTAAVYKHVPTYYPDHVGSVGGLVGMIGGLGGFVLPVMFGILNDLTNIWTSCFMLMFGVVAIALAWMHVAIRRMERRRLPVLGTLPPFPELEYLESVARSEPAAATMLDLGTCGPAAPEDFARPSPAELPVAAPASGMRG